ncbi:hypothetical protein J6590_002199 [Homalodisca vitripennis]|nr:hypothetical protein J6590_002199 [Homalodisca vitripennis]
MSEWRTKGNDTAGRVLETTVKTRRAKESWTKRGEKWSSSSPLWGRHVETPKEHKGASHLQGAEGQGAPITPRTRRVVHVPEPMVPVIWHLPGSRPIIEKQGGIPSGKISHLVVKAMVATTPYELLDGRTNIIAADKVGEKMRLASAHW